MNTRNLERKGYLVALAAVICIVYGLGKWLTG